MKKTRKLGRRTLSLFLTLVMVLTAVISIAVTSSAGEYYYGGTSCIYQFAIYYSSKRSNAQNGIRNAGYTLIDCDTTTGTGGDYYIYTGFKKSTDSSIALTAIMINIDNNAGNNQYLTCSCNGVSNVQFYRVGFDGEGTGNQQCDGVVDLNKGAGGSDIYMYVTRDKRVAGGMTNAYISNGPSSVSGWTYACRYNTTEPADLNKGAGGADLFFEYQSTCPAVDTSTLRSRISTVNGLTSSRYTSASYNAAISARDSAQSGVINTLDQSNVKLRVSPQPQSQIDAYSNNILNNLNALQTNVYFNVNGGSSMTASPQTFTIGTASSGTYYIPSSFTATKAGYSFVGWSTSPTSTSPTAAGGAIGLSFNQTLYAIYKDVTPPTGAYASYRISADGNSGYYVWANAADAASGIDRVQFPTWSNTFGQGGDTWFASTASPWNTNTMNSGTRISGDASSGTYRFYVNRADHKNSSGTVATGGIITHIYAYDQHQFNPAGTGENSANVGSITAYFPSITFYRNHTSSDNTSLGTFVGGIGQLADASGNQTSTYNTYGHINGSLTSSKIGYTFLGWSNDRNATVPNITDGTAISSSYGTDTQSLYAIYTPNVYNVYFNNLFRISDWVSCGAGNGTMVVDKDAGTVKLTSTAADCYSNTYVGSGARYVNVTAGNTYRLSFDCDKNTLFTYVFFYAPGATSYSSAITNTTDKSFTFTVPAGIDRITFRLANYNATGTTATYSNIRLQDVTAGIAAPVLSSKKATFDSALGDLTTNAKTGYTFSQWVDADNKVYTRDSIMDVADNLHLYPVWTANTYYYKFASGYEGGAADTSNYAATYDVEFELPDVMFDRELYVFTGWKCSTNGQTYVAHSKAKNVGTEPGQVVTFTAQWNGNAHYVYYNGNGATSGSMERTSHICSDTTYLRPLGFAKIGYVFKYWTKTVADNPTHWADGASITNFSGPLTSATVYAQWAPNTYTVTYKAGTGTGADVATLQTYDTAFNTRTNMFYKTGYLFNGWLCSNGQTYTENKSLVNLTADVNGSITMTAQWRPITYTVSYLTGHGADSTVLDETHTYDQSYTAKAASTYARTGYIFKDWLCSNGNVYAAGAVMKNLSADQGDSFTMTARWTPITYTVVYQPGGASGSNITVSPLTYDVPFTVKPADTFSRGTAYNFSGWLCSNGQTFSGDVETINLTATQGATVTLTAQWTAKDTFFVVRYASGLGDGTDIDVSQAVGSTVKLKGAELFSRTGYYISQWYCDFNGNYYIPGSTPGVLTKDQDTIVTMTAVWTPNDIKVIYNPNGGEGTMPNSLYKYNTRGNLLANAYTMSGAQFNGWNTEPDGTGTVYSNKASVFNLSTGADITLYAQWKYTERSVYFVTNGGTPIETAVVTVGSTFPSFSAPAYDAMHSFAGWYIDENFATPLNYTVMPNANVTLYAKWNAVTRNISFTVNGIGSVTAYINDVKTPIVGSSVTVNYGDILKLSAAAGENSEFTGFTANGVALAQNYPIAITADTAIVANFAAKVVKYTVNVVGGTVFKDTSTTVNANTLVTLVPNDAVNHGCWALDAQGNTVISESSTFAFVVTGDVTVWSIAKEVEKPSVTMFSAKAVKSGTKYNLTYTGIVSAPAGWTVTGYGLLLVKSPVASFKSNEDNFIYTNTLVGTQKISKVAASAMNTAGQYKVSVTGVPQKTACAARMYLICKDASNTTYYFYSDVNYITTP